MRVDLFKYCTEEFMAQLGPMTADRWQNWGNLEIMGIWVSDIFYD